MDTELASEVLYRVARMEKVAPDMLAVVEQGLASKTDLTLSQEMTLSGGPAAVAKVLTLAERHGGEGAPRVDHPAQSRLGPADQPT